MRVAVRLTVFCALVATAAACGDDDFSYEGLAGTGVPAVYDSTVPGVGVSVNGGSERTFLVDTGSPVTILDHSSFPDEAEGVLSVDLAAFGVVFPDLSVTSWDIPLDPLAGIIGGDLLRHFALSLDYRDGRAWLFDPFDPAAVPEGLQVEPLVSVPFELLGGGLALLPTEDVIEVPPTRVIARARFEAQADPIWVLVDSGASAVVLEESFLAQLGDLGGRPRLDGLTVGTFEGPQPGYLSRVWQVGLDAAAVDDVPVIVVPGTNLFSSISDEVGLPIQALLGGSMLRWYVTTFDYPGRQLHLARYSDPSHILPNEYVSVGFSMDPVGDDWTIYEVYPGTDAAAEGLVEGDVVEELDGMTITGQPIEVVNALVGGYAVGQELPVGIRRPSSVEPHLVTIEDLLPSYPPP